MSAPLSDGPARDFEGDHLEEIRQAACSVVASLKWLLEAAEQVIDDPEAFAEVAASGRSVVEAFVGGFTGSHSSHPAGPQPNDDAEPPSV